MKKNIMGGQAMQLFSKNPICYEIEKQLFLSEGRSDVQFFHPIYLKNEELLKRSKKIKRLEQISKRIKKGIFYILASEYTKKGVPFVRVSNLKEETIINKNLVYITEEKNRKEINTEFHPRDILISKTGNLAVSIIPETLHRCNISQDIIGIEMDKQYNSEYICIFFTTKFGITQLERLMQGQVQPHITVIDIKKVKIVLPSEEMQEKIVKNVKEAKAKRNQYFKEVKEFRKNIANFFLQELSLEYSEKKDENLFVNLLDERLDPYYYHPRFTRIIDSLKKGRFELKKLKDVAKFSIEQIDPQKEPNKYFKYIQIQNIDEINHKISSYNYILGKDTPGRARMLIREGDILLPVLGGSLKSVAIVTKKFNNEVATNGFAVLRISDKNLRHYVFYYLTTKFAQMQIERELTGAIMSSISKSELKNILIPFPSSISQERIAKKVKKLNTMIKEFPKEADDLIGKVEKEIEKMIIEE